MCLAGLELISPGWVTNLVCWHLSQLPDIFSCHCIVSAGSAPILGALVMHNRCLLPREAEQHPGDLLGLGKYFLFMH